MSLVRDYRVDVSIDIPVAEIIGFPGEVTLGDLRVTGGGMHGSHLSVDVVTRASSLAQSPTFTDGARPCVLRVEVTEEAP